MKVSWRSSNCRKTCWESRIWMEWLFLQGCGNSWKLKYIKILLLKLLNWTLCFKRLKGAAIRLKLVCQHHWWNNVLDCMRQPWDWLRHVNYIYKKKWLEFKLTIVVFYFTVHMRCRTEDQHGLCLCQTFQDISSLVSFVWQVVVQYAEPARTAGLWKMLILPERLLHYSKKKTHVIPSRLCTVKEKSENVVLST